MNDNIGWEASRKGHYQVYGLLILGHWSVSSSTFLFWACTDHASTCDLCIFTLEYPYACSYKFFSLFIHFGVIMEHIICSGFCWKANYSCSSSCYGSTRPMSSLAHLKVMSHDSAWLVAGFPWMLLLCIDLCVLDARLPG